MRLMSAAVAPLLLAACHESTEPNPLVWSSFSVVTIQTLSGVWGSSDTDIWVPVNCCGIGGNILHYDGTFWTKLSSAATEYLTGVCGSSASDVCAVGWNGTILHYNGTSWSSVSSGTVQNLNSVWGTSASDVWAVGNRVNIGLSLTLPMARPSFRRATFAPLATTMARFVPGGTATSIDCDAASATPIVRARVDGGAARKKLGIARATSPDHGQRTKSAIAAT